MASLSFPDPCPARPRLSAGRGGAEGGAGGVARAPRGSCLRRSPRPLGEPRSCGGAGGGGSARARPLGGGDARHAFPVLSRATREPRGSPLPHWATLSAILLCTYLLLSPPVSPSSLHPTLPPPIASPATRAPLRAGGAALGCRARPPKVPSSTLGGHERQHGHQALLRQPLR